MSNSMSSTMDARYDQLSDHLCRCVDDQPSPKRQYWVAIAGGPGSGKTTVATAVCERINRRYNGEYAVVVPMDGFHYTQQRLKDLHGADAIKRRGAPWTFDARAFHQALLQVKEKGEGSFPTYSREISDPVPRGVVVQKDHRILIVEGLYLLHERDPEWKPLQDLWDETWFVKAPNMALQKERLIRRSLRTWTEAKASVWGDGVEGVTKRVEANDSLHLEVIEYCEQLADKVIVTE